VLFTGLEPDDIAGANLLDGTAFALSPTGSRCNDEGLAEWMRMPCCSRAWLKGYDGAADPRRIGGCERLIDAYCSSEPI
jgi:hypothetical protein